MFCIGLCSFFALILHGSPPTTVTVIEKEKISCHDLYCMPVCISGYQFIDPGTYVGNVLIATEDLATVSFKNDSYRNLITERTLSLISNDDKPVLKSPNNKERKLYNYSYAKTWRLKNLSSKDRHYNYQLTSDRDLNREYIS